jgi:L-threonylcarbamoyladenylate synthase
MKCEILAAAKKIKDGDVVAFPTETVYGIGASAFSDEACSKIYSLKSRPSNNPLIVHVYSLGNALEIGHFTDNAIKIAESFWPGPVSIVVKLKDSRISKIVTAGLDTIAIRVPSHQIALGLLKEAELPIAAPSANPSNYISPTLADHVRRHFDQAGIMILDGGRSIIGLESTIIDASIDGENVILRDGFITKEDFEKIGVRISDIEKKGIIAPGMMKKHYSPKTKIRLNASVSMVGEICLNFGKNIVENAEYSLNLSVSGDLEEAGANLYMMLRELDIYAMENNIDSIGIAEIPNHAVGIAINDKLKRAAVLQYEL